MMESSSKRTTLVTGSMGQIGSELVPALAEKFGHELVMASDVKRFSVESEDVNRDSFVQLDVRDISELKKVVTDFDVGTIYHLAGILSVSGELDPERTISVNVNGLLNVLEVSRSHNVKVFWPSSIAVFGLNAARINTPQDSPISPQTVYGITKAAGEMLCNYYFHEFGLDVRSLRLPGIISSKTPPGGGTTDYAVEIFYEALKNGRYTCFVTKDTELPMLYMPDCIRAIHGIMEAEASQVTVRTSYNLGGMNFSVEELAEEIKKFVPELIVEYMPDSRMQIADTWPRSIDDSRARKDWGWRETYNLTTMAEDMIHMLSERQRS